MAVELTATEYSGVGTGASATYATGVYANASDQIKVYVADVLQTIGDDYSLNGVGSETGVDVIGSFTAAAAVYIKRVTPITQAVDTQNNETILEDVLDGALDKLTLIAQEQARDTGRTLRFPEGEAGHVLPEPGDRAGRVLGFDINGDPILSNGDGNDPALRLDLASAANSLGASLVRHNPLAAQAAGSVGAHLKNLPLITDFGAAGDWNGTTGTDNTSVFQSVIDLGLVVRVPVGNFYCAGQLKLRDNFGFIGEGFAGASDVVAGFPCPRIILAGTGRSGIVNNNPAVGLNKGVFENLVITTTETAQLNYVIDVNGCIDVDILNVQIENRWVNGGGFRSVKVGSDPTWVNRVVNLKIKLYDASTRYAFDVDWTDSEIIGGIISGGKGSVFRGNGNMKAVAVQFERANAGGAGLTLSKETVSNGEIPIIGCTFDENLGPGLFVTAASSPGGAFYAPVINGCMFRNPSAVNDIVFDPTTGVTLYGPSISDCVFSTAATPMSVDPTKWDVVVGDNAYTNLTWVQARISDTRSALRLLSRYGINLPAPMEIRANRTLRGLANVAVAFGVGIDAEPLAVAGSLTGTAPFFGASRNAAGVGTPLAFVTDNLARLYIPANGIDNYANDAAAAAGGVPLLGVYRNGNALQIRLV